MKKHTKELLLVYSILALLMGAMGGLWYAIYQIALNGQALL